VFSLKGGKNMKLLEVNNLKKIYATRFGGNQVQALSNVTFSVEKGEYVAIMGESGSGKTTLLNILASLDKPTSGEVLLQDKNIVAIKESEIVAFRRDNLGFVFQDFNLLDTFSIKDNIFLPLVLSRKSYEEMEKSINKAQQELGRSMINIFHLHAARSTPAVFEERKGALECLKDYKKKGIIQAIGISTHAVDVVEKAAEEPDIDVIFPIINIDGMGIIRGNTTTMIKAIQKASMRGKGIYAMKVLAGGHCIDRIFDAIEFVRNIREISSIAIGVVREVELDFHLLHFNQQPIPKELLNQCLDRKQKKPVILNNCRKCRLCSETCPSGAITMGHSNRPSDGSF